MENPPSDLLGPAIPTAIVARLPELGHPNIALPSPLPTSPTENTRLRRGLQVGEVEEREIPHSTLGFLGVFQFVMGVDRPAARRQLPSQAPPLGCGWASFVDDECLPTVLFPYGCYWRLIYHSFESRISRSVRTANKEFVSGVPELRGRRTAEGRGQGGNAVEPVERRTRVGLTRVLWCTPRRTVHGEIDFVVGALRNGVERIVAM